MEKVKKFLSNIDNNIKFINLKKIYKYIYRISANFNLFFFKKDQVFKNIHYSNSNNLLCELSQKYGSDKGWLLENYDKSPFEWAPHTYTSFYYSIFDFNRENTKLVFECGIGTNKVGLKSSMGSIGKPGASLRMWKDYFPNANIYGADIDRDILFNEDRINTYYVDQLNTESIKSMWKDIGLNNFDIIIDDGLHEVNANLNFFFNSFDKLKKNGIYVIEDVKLYDISKLYNKLKKFSPEIIVLNSKISKAYIDNNLIIVRKN